MTTFKKKILFCDNTLWGLINFRGQVIQHFVQKGFDVILVAPEKEDRQMRIEVPQDVRYVPIKMGRTSINPLNDLKYFMRLLKTFIRVRPDYIFNYTIKPNIYGSIAGKLCGAHVTAMMAGMGYVFTNKTFMSKIARGLYKCGLTFADHLLLLNQENVRIVKKYHICKASKIVLLEGGEGVDIGRFSYYENDNDRITFLFIGRVLWEKGYEEFSKAAKEICQRYKNVEFQVLGSLDPSYPKSVPLERIHQDEANGFLKYLGFTNDMVSVFKRKGLVIVLPSFYGEGLNRTLMEACATGKPIITTDIAGCRETVIDGENGFIVKPHDYKSLVEALERYISLPSETKASFSERSRKIAEERFDIRHVVKIYDEIVDDDC